MSARRNVWEIVAVLGIGLSIIPVSLSAGRARADTASDAIFPPGSLPEGYKLGLLAMACWAGGVWSDAEGAPPARWRERDDQRCLDLVNAVWGRFDPARYEQIRATEDRAVGDLLAKIRSTEPAATRERTVALFRDVAAAAHEGMLARRAADRIKIDYEADTGEAKLTADQRRAATALADHRALERFLVAPQPSNTDRRAIGLLFALDRMEMAPGLPKQLKFYALGHVFTSVFDVAPPPADALNLKTSPRPGTWLTYLSGVAARAGYPVADNPALTHKMRETLAWTGVGRGFADRLRQQGDALPNAAVPELSRVVSSVATRLENERASVESMSKAHAAGEPAR